jgi:Zn-dependent protease with chaperone function
MPTVTVSQINEKLQSLPPQKLAVVFDFVSYLAEQQTKSDSFQTMLASEAVLRRDWDRPEEDEAWADL